ncbi:MAG: efflux RND transporter periplasmic adaptor subunit [bacterium]
MNKLTWGVFFGVATFCIFACHSNSERAVETFVVKRGNFVLSVIENGELEAVNSKTISAPMIPWNLGGLKIAKLVDDGQQVEKGQVLMEFVKTEVQKNLDDARANWDIAQAELRKTRATQQSELDELEMNLKKSELQFRISQLELQKATFEADIEKKRIELDLEKSRISLEKARQEISNKKKVHHEELSKLKLKVKQERTKVEEAQETLEKLSMKAPAPGIAILKKNWNTGNKIQVDDDVWRGQPIIGLPDLSLMQAIVQVNEVDIGKIDTALKAVIKIDAYPDSSFPGKVTEIAALARNKERDSKVKVFDVTVVLEETDKTLMPGMTVSCEIVVKEIPDTLFVPLDAIHQKDGQTVVYLKNGDEFKPQPVVLAEENDDFVIIAQGLAAGDEISLMDPTAAPVSTDGQEGEKK